jgi:EAL domain-containing protein (putative c-di-GMP-specific phosphodiesterase class I)
VALNEVNITRGDARSVPLFCRAKALAWLNPGINFVFGWVRVFSADEKGVPDTALESCIKILRARLGSEALIEHLWGSNVGFFSRSDAVNDAELCRGLQSGLANLNGRRYRIQMGLHLAKHPEAVSARMLAFAGLAMHLAGKNAKLPFKWYDDDFLDTPIAREIFYGLIEQAIGQELFVIYFQPVFDCKEQPRIVAAEALVRWRHPYYGFLLPSLFLPLLGRMQMLDVVDLHMLSRACQLQAKRIDAGLPIVPISVNLARDDMLLDEEFSSKVIKTVDSHGLDHSLVQFELLEGYPSMDDISNYPLGTVARQVGLLHDAGFSILIDDYGSGASDINTLCTMPFDILKLDKHLIDQCTDNKTVSCILQSLVNCMHEMGHEIIAEGVETPRQLETMHKMGCKLIQGFYLSKPLPIVDFEALLEQQKQANNHTYTHSKHLN